MIVVDSVKQSVRLVLTQNQLITKLNTSSDKRVCTIDNLKQLLEDAKVVEQEAVQFIDGVPHCGILLTNQADSSENGVWYVSLKNC